MAAPSNRRARDHSRGDSPDPLKQPIIANNEPATPEASPRAAGRRGTPALLPAARLVWVPDDPLCELFGQEHEHPSNKPPAALVKNGSVRDNRAWTP